TSAPPRFQWLIAAASDHAPLKSCPEQLMGAGQLCFSNAAHGGNALYVSLLAESHDRLLSYMRPMRFYDAEVLPDRISYLSAFPILMKEGPAALQRLLVEEIRRRNATLVIVDGLFVIHDVFGSEAEFRRFVHEVQGVASLMQSAILMLTNQSRERSSPEFTMVDGWMELIDEIREARSVRALVVHKQRGSAYLRGRHVFRITDDGIVVFPRLEAAQPRQPALSSPMARVSSGIAQFDTMLQGGYPSTSSTIIIGPSGSGKTTLGLHFLTGSTPESPGLMFGFYEPPTHLMAKARAVGVDLEGLVARGAVEILWQPVADNLADELGWRIIDTVRRTGAKRVVVDGMEAFDRALLFPRRLPTLINALNNILKPLGTTVLYTREIDELHELRSLPDDLSAKSENLVLLHYERHERLLRRMLSILKVRDSDFDPFSEEFYVTDQGIRFGQQPTPKGRRPAGAADISSMAPPSGAALPSRA
ncbi:RAD55 family ATPase, partial [Teichococcus aestuarii]|uniref:RAD55 family ATPase n=2 Tax=Teichococcus aestuarii TaxID=568898 RepID=UPI003612E4BA